MMSLCFKIKVLHKKELQRSVMYNVAVHKGKLSVSFVKNISTGIFGMLFITHVALSNIWRNVGIK